MNASWRPCFHADVADAFADAKLEWVASANLLENFDRLTLSDTERAMRDRFDDHAMRELIKDLCLARGLRTTCSCVGQSAWTLPRATRRWASSVWPCSGAAAR